METATEELYLQKIEELVFDEDKIVTISIICQKLDVSLFEAKELLEKYVSNHIIDPGKIAATYLISGKLKTGKFAIEIVSGSCLKEKKKQFESITDKVVYSVQKNKVIDFNLIALSEQLDDANLRPAALKGSIVSAKCIERDIKTKVLPPLPPPKNFEKQKSSSFFKPVPKDQTNGDKEKSTNKEVKTQTQKKTGGLTSFLSQSSTTKGKPQEVKKENSSEDEPDSKKARIESDKSEEIIDTLQDKKDEIKTVKTDSKTAKNKKTPKKNPGKKDEDGKKRKRIIVESDSDDDLFANMEDEKMEVVESDEEPPVDHKPKVQADPVPKNKRRKAVEKTYEDDEGYVVTRTEYVLVSASEDEEENVAPPKKENKAAPKPEPKEEKKISPVKVGKKKGKAVAANQPTLMNFFKKK